ncbi:MAG: nucleotide exchange factor GrpE [Balneolaceae bacterium]|nr:nucleotide exchange factor GrpE [Balneolaceae bacterium]
MSETNEKVDKEEQADGEEQQVEAAKPEESRETDYEALEKQELIALLVERDRQIEQIQQELEEAQDARLRKAAELENVKKRMERDRARIFESARISALEDFLPVNDDLRRTLKAFEGTDVDQNFMDGIRMVADKFEEVLKRHGVERIDEEMVPFDVDLHDAMMRQKPEDEDVESDMVLKVMENGYRIGDRTIRHAKVIVSE